MRHMGNSGRIAIGAFCAALALLVLTAVTLHETVALWFLAATVAAYVACVSEVVIRRRHRTLVASGIGSILFIAFGMAFLRQWGLAFNSDPAALSARVDSAHPDLYFYLAAASGAATLLLLFAGTVLPGRRLRAGYSAQRRPAPVPRKTAARGTASGGVATGRAVARQAPRAAAQRATAPRAAGKAATARTQPAQGRAPRAVAAPVKRPAPAGGASGAAKVSAKSPVGPSARTSRQR